MPPVMEMRSDSDQQVNLKRKNGNKEKSNHKNMLIDTDKVDSILIPNGLWRVIEEINI